MRCCGSRGAPSGRSSPAVAADAVAARDPLAGLRRIGIDEISYQRGHRYLTVVVDHDQRRLVWAKPGRDKATLNAFFDALGPERCAAITHMSAGGADWIADVVAARCSRPSCVIPMNRGVSRHPTAAK